MIIAVLCGSRQSRKAIEVGLPKGVDRLYGRLRSHRLHRCGDEGFSARKALSAIVAVMQFKQATRADETVLIGLCLPRVAPGHPSLILVVEG